MTRYPIQHDRTAKLIAERRRESPRIPLDGIEILTRAQRLIRLSRRWIDPVFERHGLDAGEFDVLATLQRAGAPYCQRPTEIFQSLMITSGGLTDRLTRLARKGLVERIVPDDDRRSIMVRLTDAGLMTIAAAFAEDMAVEADLLVTLDADDRCRLATLLARLLSELETRHE